MRETISTLLGIPGRLRALRDALGGREALLSALQMKRAQWDRYESGKHLPRTDVLTRIAEIADRSTLWLLTGAESAEIGEAHGLQQTPHMTPEESAICLPLMRALLRIVRSDAPGRVSHVANQLAYLIDNRKAARDNPDIAAALDAIAKLQRQHQKGVRRGRAASGEGS